MTVNIRDAAVHRAPLLSMPIHDYGNEMSFGSIMIKHNLMTCKPISLLLCYVSKTKILIYDYLKTYYFVAKPFRFQ